LFMRAQRYVAQGSSRPSVLGHKHIEYIVPASVSRIGGRTLMRTGRPIAPLSLTVEERDTVERRARQRRARRRSALALCWSARWAIPTPRWRGGGEARRDLRDGRQMVPTVPGAAVGRVPGRTAPPGRRVGDTHIEPHRKTTAPGRPSQHPRTGKRHPPLP